MEQKPPAQNPVPTPPSASPQKPSPNPDADLIKDLTIGLPPSFKLLEESLLLFQKKFLSFFLVLMPVILPLYLLYKLPQFISIPVGLSTLLYRFGFIYTAMLLFSFGYLALLFAIKDNEENISVLDAYKRAKKAYLEYWKILLIILCLLAFGLLAFIIPGINFFIWCSIALMVYLAEDAKGFDAILLSKQYVQGYWVSVLSRLIFLSVIVCLISLPLIIFRVFNESYIYDILFILILMVVIPVINTFLFLIYGNLKLLKPNSTELTEALKKTVDYKIKLKLIKPVFLEGFALGIPLVLVIIYLFVFRFYQVKGDGMKPSFPAKTVMILNVAGLRTESISRGDVIVYKSPLNPKHALIGRVIGLPGEQIMVSENAVYIDNQILEESQYLKPGLKTIHGSFLKNGYSLPISLAQYAVFMDNRDELTDSRTWGFIRQTDIIGRAGICLLYCPKNTE